MEAPRTPSPLEAAQRQRTLILRVVRYAFFAMITTVAILLTIQSQQRDSLTGAPLEWWQPVSISIFLFCLAILVDLATPAKKLATISAIFFGLLAGMLATAAISAVIDLLIAAWVPRPEVVAGTVAMVKVMLGMALCYMGVSAVLQTQDEFRLVIPYVEFSKQTRGVRPNLLDSSALIDARIADLALTGLIQSPLIVPGCVIDELQSLADSSDKLKRARGRRGLDVLSRLQRIPTVDMSIDDLPTSSLAVDQALIELAERLGARIFTTDSGLQRVAEIRGLQVINLHDIANALKPALVPGEHIIVSLVKPGEQPNQGVGYLDDGTMIVAEHGLPYVGGDEVALLVTSAMQTANGRLIFAKAPRADHAEPDLASDSPSPDLHKSESNSPEAQAPTTFEAADPIPASVPPNPPTLPPIEPRRAGPFPPKPPARRTSSSHNPRR